MLGCAGRANNMCKCAAKEIEKSGFVLVQDPLFNLDQGFVKAESKYCWKRQATAGVSNWRSTGQMHHVQTTPTPVPQRERTSQYVM